MATITVKSARKDGRVAFFERDKAHPNGSVLVKGNGQPVKVGDTQALRRAIRQGNLVEVHTQAAPVNRTQKAAETGKTDTQGDNKLAAPWEGYDDLRAEEVVARLDTLDDAGRASVLAYEQSKGERGRKTIIEKLTGVQS